MLTASTGSNGIGTPAADFAALQALVLEQKALLADRDATVGELKSMLAVEKLARERAESKVRDLLRRFFGPKSEKLNPDQYTLAIEPVEVRQAPAAAQTPPASPPATVGEKPKRKSGGRRPAPENLPVEIVRIDLPEKDRTGLVHIRDEITEELDYRPSQFFRRHYVRAVYADPEHVRRPVIAELPARVLPQTGAGPGLIAHLLVSKFVDHLPLNRLEKIAARAGIELSRQKQCRWVEGAARLLLTVADQLKTRILNSGYVQVDETPVRVLDPARPGHAAQAYLWTYLSPTRQSIVFDFHLSRGRDSPERFFPEDWGGVLQSDGYELYAKFIREHPKILHAGCMAHLRRYLIDALQGGDESVTVLLADIGALYRLEAQARDRKLSAHQRACLRHAYARPILRSLQQRFRHISGRVLPKSALGKAATYALNHWPQLSRYAKQPFAHVSIDNNSIERGIRATKIGMKNWMFIGHPDAGWHSAVIYSVTGTCQLLKIDPHAYIAWVLPKLAAATTKNTAGLLPHDFAAL